MPPTRRPSGQALPLLLALALAAAARAGQPISVRAAVEKQQVFVGEAFLFQIQVHGSDKPLKPTLPPIPGLSAEALGGRQNNSESVTIINGRMTRTVRRAYIFSYRLTPTQAGSLTIPAVAVTVEGQALRTQPIAIQAREPAETKDFKLRMTLSKPACYVGEPVELTLTWYLAKDVRRFQFALPVLGDSRFRFDDPPVDSGGDPRRFFRLAIGAHEAIGEKGRGTLDGRTYTTLTVRKVLIPRQPGSVAIARATVACEALVGRRRPRSPFGGFFDDDFFGRGGLYRKFVTPSNALRLEVKALPEEGRPAHFAGHVGAWRIEASAEPTEVNVGDPITLTVRLSGPPYLKHAELPPLAQQPALARDFKIPAERAEGKVEGAAKIFTQTLRATRDTVARIPPIELPYFDADSATYRVARTQAIPLTVHPTKIVTARDAEGRDLSPARAELEALAEGIADNYEDLSVLDNQAVGLAAAASDPLWLSLAGLPLLGYLVLLVATTTVRRRQADPAAVEARRAYRQLAKALKAARAAPEGSGAVLEALRAYLGRKLRVPGAALTFRDVEAPLRERGVDPQALERLQALFEQCEAGRYAGAAPAAADKPLDDRARAIAKDLERSLK